MAWAPQTDFENEIVSLEPNDDFIYGNFDFNPPRPQEHFECKEKMLKQKEEYKNLSAADLGKLEAIGIVQRIVGTKDPGKLPSLSDWDNTEDAGREITAMMRHFGMGPANDARIEEDQTEDPTPKDSVKIMRCGKTVRPIFLGEDWFKMRPLKELQEESNPQSIMASKSPELQETFCLLFGEDGKSNACGELHRNKIKPSYKNYGRRGRQSKYNPINNRSSDQITDVNAIE